MAKEIILEPLKKGKSEFSLIGKAKISDYTFSLDNVSEKNPSNPWIYSRMSLSVDCGKHGNIFAEMMGGHATTDGVVYAHGKKESEDGTMTQDDFKQKMNIAWEDRFDDEIVNQCGERCFVTVELETDINDKVVTRKFLSEYDAIDYIQKVLEDEMVIYVKGDLQYSQYNGELQVKKIIKSISLSKAEEKDFKATFSQAMYIDKDSVGKLDKELMIVPITSYVVESVDKFNDKPIRFKHPQTKKDCKRLTLPLMKVFDLQVGEDELNTYERKLKFFKAKPKKVTQITVDGIFTKEQLNTVQISEKDIPSDIMELIELGYMKKDEVLNQMAFKNGGNKSKEKMVIKSPSVKYTKNTEGAMIPSVNIVTDMYDTINFDVSEIFRQYGINIDNETSNTNESLEDATESDVVEDENVISDAEADDWLNSL